MIVETLKLHEYKGMNVYVRRFGIVFEFLVLYEQQLFQKHMIVKPRFWRRVLREKNRYSKKQKAVIAAMLLGAAEKTIDDIIKRENVEKFKDDKVKRR